MEEVDVSDTDLTVEQVTAIREAIGRSSCKVIGLDFGSESDSFLYVSI